MYRVYHAKTPSFLPDAGNWPDGYQAVAEVEGTCLDDVFLRTNSNDTPWWENIGVKLLAENPRSTSVGDVVIDERGRVFLCDVIGWQEIRESVPFILLDMPAPPMLEAALGYEEREASDVYPHCRFVAFCWWGSKLAYADGQVMSNTSYHAWLMMIRHPVFMPVSLRWDFGTDDGPARHWLLVDSITRRLYVGRAREVEAFLDQCQRPRFPEISPQEQEAINASVMAQLRSIKFEEFAIDEQMMERIHKQMEQEFALVEELRNWLDTYATGLSREAEARLGSLFVQEEKCTDCGGEMQADDWLLCASCRSAITSSSQPS